MIFKGREGNHLTGRLVGIVALNIFLFQLNSCSSGSGGVNVNDPLLRSYQEKFVIMTPPVYCKGCLVKTLEIMRKNLSHEDYVIVSPREPLVAIREERYQKVSVDMYQRIMGQNASVYAIYNGKTNTYKEEMKEPVNFRRLVKFMEGLTQG
jgi:hypothetical protein